MEFAVFTEPQQGARYSDLLRVAQAAEQLGFAAFFRSDHYLAFGTEGLPGPTDAWVTLGALARETTRIRLGTLVTSATFRHPGPLAVSVAQVDEMSGGRIEFGLGAGWFENEHTAYGIPFPPLGERFDRLEEQLAIIEGLWTSDGPFSYDGRHYTVTDSPGLPKPVQRPRPPIIIGGKGRKRTPELAARYADEFNVPFSSVQVTGEVFERVRAVSTRELRYSVAQTLFLGRDEAEARRRADAVGGRIGDDSVIGGTVAAVVDQIGAYRELGVSRMHLQILDLGDLDHLELVAGEVIPQLR